jgi:hypothetical protein
MFKFNFGGNVRSYSDGGLVHELVEAGMGTTFFDGPMLPSYNYTHTFARFVLFV